MEESNKKDGAMMIASAIIGLDYKTVIVNDKSYIIEPPTIAKIAGASYWLCDYGEGTTLRDILKCLSKAENLAKALSWLIQENDELSEEPCERKPYGNSGWYRSRIFYDRSHKFYEAISFTEERKTAGSKTEMIGNECMLGQIASFMEAFALLMMR